MQAIAFMTKAKNGVIEIPKEYVPALNDEFQVIIVVSAKKTPKTKKKLTSLKIKTKGLIFDRDEANER